MKNEKIVCVTQPVSLPGSRRIHVTIDGANKATFEFMYTENPVFSSVYPRNVIPALVHLIKFTYFSTFFQLTFSNNNLNNLVIQI